MAVALLALIIAASGAAVAAIPSADGTITACRDNKSGALRVIDAEPPQSQTCTSRETQLAWKNGLTGSTVANADKLDNKDSTEFYAAGSKVADSSHADQADSAASAGDANTLDGKDSTQFADSSHTHSGADITSGTVEADRIEDGQGSNLNADQLDGLDSTQLPHGFYQVEDVFTQASSANGFAVGEVLCDEGDQVVGGGYAGDLHPTTSIAADSPSLDRGASGTQSGWVITWKTADPSTTETIRVAALCADFGASHP